MVDHILWKCILPMYQATEIYRESEAEELARKFTTLPDLEISHNIEAPAANYKYELIAGGKRNPPWQTNLGNARP